MVDGANLTHGNKLNQSDVTRVSIDFRVLPLRFYNEHEAQQTITTKTKLALGHYFSLFKF